MDISTITARAGGDMKYKGGFCMAAYPCPVTQSPCPSPSPALSQPLQAQAAALGSPRSLLLPRLTSPSSPSLPSQQRGSSPRIIAGASSGPAPTAPGLPCAEGSGAGHRTPGGSQQTRAERQNPPSSPCCPRCWGCSPGHRWPLGCQRTLLGDVELLVNQHP